MAAGDRDTLISFEQRQTSQDPVYHTTVEESWEEVSQAWAEVQDILPSRAESVDDSISMLRRPARVRVDYLDGLGITSDMRIFIQGFGDVPDRTLKIVGAPAHKRDTDEFEMIAEELSTTGHEP